MPRAATRPRGRRAAEERDELAPPHVGHGPSSLCAIPIIIHRKRAAQARNPSVKSAYQEVARAWLLLAEQLEWMDGQEEASRPKDT